MPLSAINAEHTAQAAGGSNRHALIVRVTFDRLDAFTPVSVLIHPLAPASFWFYPQ